MINKLEVIGSILPLNWEPVDIRDSSKKSYFDRKLMVSTLGIKFNRSFQTNPQTDVNPVREAVSRDL